MRRYFTVFSLDGPGHREAAPAVLRPYIGLARARFDHAADASLLAVASSMSHILRKPMPGSEQMLPGPFVCLC